MWPKLKTVANAPITIVLVAAVGLIVAASVMRGGGSYPPAPDQPVHDQAKVRAGRDRVEDLKDAYAKSLRAAADAIVAGQHMEEAKNVQVVTMEKALQASFDAKIRPILVTIVPDDAPDLTDAQRAALAGAYRDFALGVSGKETNNPATGPPSSKSYLRSFFGWVDHPARRAALIATLPDRTFTAAAPQLITGKTADVFLYKAWRDILGNYPSYPAQQIGDCTSFGASHALDLLQCVELSLSKGKAADYRETSTEVVYGFSREIAGLLGSYGDGSYGVATAKGLTQFGALSRETVGPYSGGRAKDFGRNGVPSDLKAKAADFKLGNATLVTTLAEADAALMNGYPFIVCSNQGFTLKRNADGVCEASGTWPHCMFVAGRRDKNGEAQYLIVQSWGEKMPSGPISDDQPPYSFWARGNTVARMLAGEDSLAFSHFNGFVGRTLPDHWHYSGFLQPKPEPEPIATPQQEATKPLIVPGTPTPRPAVVPTPNAAPLRPAPPAPVYRQAA